ncbi:hypothetical protein BGX31_002885 [Mortierella sp. GBA43]|nr:hypothetical protein BGX31_002885 [Mortierella sp. GBA43]
MVVDVEQTDQSVTNHPHWRWMYHGDILVGADGAHSAIRDRLFEQLDKENKLPAANKTGLTTENICIAGITRPLGPEGFLS